MASTMKMLPIASITITDQIRKKFDEVKLKELSESIKNVGVLQPIIVRGNGSKDQKSYSLIAGERRVRASMLAGLTEIPAIVMVTDVALNVQVIENIQRENLTLEENAAAVNELYKQYKTQAEVAQVVGKSIPWVSKMISVHNNLSTMAYELLAVGATSDIELLGLITRIEGLENSFPRLDNLVQSIIENKAGRQDAKDLYAELQEELQGLPPEDEGEQEDALTTDAINDYWRMEAILKEMTEKLSELKSVHGRKHDKWQEMNTTVKFHTNALMAAAHDLINSWMLVKDEK